MLLLALAEFARVLRPAGTFTALILHPCFYGRRGERANPDSYYQGRPITEHFLVDGLRSPAPATSWTRPLADYITMLTAAGFTVTAMSEPRPTDEQLATNPWWAESFQYPPFLLITARRLGAVA
ncbi:hypothetical protein MXD61_12375 [Frankia sp. AgPm24]|uniref:hypothetical protein n=1 Tax=Frankia sp. AgPm24 TaxID=631128 RepID=UPI00200EFCAA|nr:hypothetical protein [Frankia sp. AgPm24]MCK9922657.1 hypothetical protein [Frankia sp. AgPm24]